MMKTVIKLLQGPKNQKCPFPESNQIHEKWQTKLQRTHKKSTSSRIKPDINEILKTSFKDPQKNKTPKFTAIKQNQILFSMKPIIQRDTQITFTLSSGWKQGWIMPFMSR